MFGPDRGGCDDTSVHQFKCRNQMRCEIRAAAIIGQGGDGRNHIGIAHKSAKAGSHAMDGQDHPGRDAVSCFKIGVKSGALGLRARPCFTIVSAPRTLRNFSIVFLKASGCGRRRWWPWNNWHLKRRQAFGANASGLGLGGDLGLPRFNWPPSLLQGAALAGMESRGRIRAARRRDSDKMFTPGKICFPPYCEGRYLQPLLWNGDFFP